MADILMRNKRVECDAVTFFSFQLLSRSRGCLILIAYALETTAVTVYLSQPKSPREFIKNRNTDGKASAFLGLK